MRKRTRNFQITLTDVELCKSGKYQEGTTMTSIDKRAEEDQCGDMQSGSLGSRLGSAYPARLWIEIFQLPDSPEELCDHK